MEKIAVELEKKKKEDEEKEKIRKQVQWGIDWRLGTVGYKWGGGRYSRGKVG
jgi:hypothetical protein